MSHFNKASAMFLSLALVFSACSASRAQDGEQDDRNADKTYTEQSERPEISGRSRASATTPPTAAQTTRQTEAEALPGAQDEKREYVPGRWDREVYTNDFLGIIIQKPDGWGVLNDEGLDYLMQLNYAETIKTPLLTELLNKKILYDMGLATPTVRESIILMVDNLSMSLGGTSMDEEAYITGMSTSFQRSEYDYGILETGTLTIAGEEYMSIIVNKLEKSTNK